MASRGPGGHIKFNKDTTMWRWKNVVEHDDVDMDEVVSVKLGVMAKSGIGTIQSYNKIVQVESTSINHQYEIKKL